MKFPRRELYFPFLLLAKLARPFSTDKRVLSVLSWKIQGRNAMLIKGQCQVYRRRKNTTKRGEGGKSSRNFNWIKPLAKLFLNAVEESGVFLTGEKPSFRYLFKFGLDVLSPVMKVLIYFLKGEFPDFFKF